MQTTVHMYSNNQVTIREALQELVAWSQTAELKLVDHEENGRRYYTKTLDKFSSRLQFSIHR